MNEIEKKLLLSDFKIRFAKVIDNEDKDKLGKVQIKIFPEMSEVEDSDLPWAFPFLRSGEHNLPPKDAIIAVYVEEPFWSTFWYADVALWNSENYVFDKDSGDIDIEGYSVSYPQPTMLRKTPAGSFFLEDSEDGDFAFQHKTGAYVHFDKDGKLTIKYVKKFKLEDLDGKIKIEFDAENEKATIEVKKVDLKVDELNIADAGDNVALFKPLEKVINKLLNHVHISPGPGPTLPPIESESNPTPLSSTLTSDVNDIKSTVVKSD